MHVGTYRYNAIADMGNTENNLLQFTDQVCKKFPTTENISYHTQKQTVHKLMLEMMLFFLKQPNPLLCLTRDA